MVAQKLTPEQVVEEAESLALPDSVVQYFRGEIGQPPGGFPEPITSRVRKGRPMEDGSTHFSERPGASLDPYDFDAAREMLEAKYGPENIKPVDVLSHALYPKVFNDWKEFGLIFGDVGELSTELFLYPMKLGQESELELETGYTFLVKLVSIGDPDASGIRQVIFELNGERWFVPVTDKSSAEVRMSHPFLRHPLLLPLCSGFSSLHASNLREKASMDTGSVGAPMPGVVVDVKVKVGDVVTEGEQIITMSAMKMETAIPAPRSGVVKRVTVNAGDK
ncbi:MAG: hypothetical protein SGPRY_008961, partial [Prymnesium sp.]